MHLIPKDSGLHEYDNYAKAILDFPINSFDLVFVDGRNRAECTKHAVSRVKPGGYLVLDDSQREQYQVGIDLLSDWKCDIYELGNTEGKTTTIFRKPEDENLSPSS